MIAVPAHKRLVQHSLPLRCSDVFVLSLLKQCFLARPCQVPTRPEGPGAQREAGMKLVGQASEVVSARSRCACCSMPCTCKGSLLACSLSLDILFYFHSTPALISHSWFPQMGYGLHSKQPAALCPDLSISLGGHIKMSFALG